MKKVYGVFVLTNGYEIFAEFGENGIISIPFNKIKSIYDIWTEYDIVRLEFMLAEYEDRFVGWRIAEIEITETFSFSFVGDVI